MTIQTSTSTSTSTRIHTSGSTRSKRKGVANVLETCLQASRDEGKRTLLFVDFNNVRGKSDFSLCHADTLSTIKSWMKSMSLQREQSEQQDLFVICAIDHGSQPQTHLLEEDNNLLMVFAGPDQTADDIIAYGTRWFVSDSGSETEETHQPNSTNNNNINNNNNMVFVVTSDGELRMRCLRANHNHANRNKRKKQKDRVKVFASPHFLECLDKATPQHHRPQQRTCLEEELARVENDVRLYESKRPPWSSRKEKLAAMESGPWTSTLLDDQPSTYNSADLTTSTFHERTWHRVLIAEVLRQMVVPTKAGDRIQSLRSPSNESFTRYQAYYLEKYTNPSFLERRKPCTLWDDHRIRYDRDAQHYLRFYIEESFRTTNQTVPDLVIGDEKKKDSAPTTLIDENGGSDNATDTTHLGGDDNLPQTSLEASVELLQRLVTESPAKTQDQILQRYMQEAPSHLQFSRRSDLRDLFVVLAVRERRDPDKRARWYLKEQSSSSPSLSSWNLEFYVQPGRGRRRAKKRSKAMQESLPVNEERNQALATRMELLQFAWFSAVVSRS